MSIRILALLTTVSGLVISCSLFFPLSGFEGDARDAGPSNAPDAADAGSDPCSVPVPGVGPTDAGPPGTLVRCGPSMVDLRDNPNCGECFHDCGGNVACNDGVCADDVFDPSIGSGSYARPLSLRDGDLVWSWQGATILGSLQHRLVDGGARGMLATDSDIVDQAAEDDANYYFFGKDVHASPRDGGRGLILAQLPMRGNMALGADDLYVTQRLGDAVLRISKDGGGSSLLTRAASPSEILWDGPILAWTSWPGDGGSGNVTRYSIDGGALEPSSTITAPTGLTADARWDYVYDAGQSAVLRLSRADVGAPPQRLATVALPGASVATGAHVDQSALYIALVTSTDPAGMPAGVVVKVPKCGGVPRVFASGIFPFRLLGDETYVYVGNAKGLLLRYRK